MASERDFDVLSRQVHSLRQEVRSLTEYVDTVSSPLYKRLWWVAQGYRWRRVGRWYWKTEDLR